MSLNKAQFEKSMKITWELSSSLTTYDIVIQALNHLGLNQCRNMETHDPRFQMRLKWLEEVLSRCKQKGFDLNQSSLIGFTAFSGWALSGQGATLHKIEVLKTLHHHGASALYRDSAGLQVWENLQKSVFADPLLIQFVKNLAEEEEVKRLQEHLQDALPEASSVPSVMKKHL